MMSLVRTLVMLLVVSVVSSFCPDGCGCDEEKLTVTCIRARLEVMPISLNPSIQTLILKYNEFHSVDASFNFYSELVKVDLSHNHLVSIPSRAFKSQRRLRDLRMRANKISDIDQDTFDGLGKLESLDLRENFIEALRRGCFHDLSNLKQLDLGKNRIKEIDDNAFSGVNDVVILYLDDNQLETVPTKAFQDLNNLAELHLARNNFKIVKDSSFQPHSFLTFLDLNGNRIKKMEDLSLQGLKALKTLKLKDNKFRTIPTKTFEALENLEELSIGQNKFEIIRESAFGPLSKLKVIDISGCENLHRIQSKAFSNNSDLERVNIHSNRRLAEIHPQSFDTTVNLRHVNLANNALTKISPTLIPWHQLMSAQLTGNPWNCDCSAIFIRDLIISLVNNSSQVRVTKCWSPPSHRDRDIVTLDLPDCHFEPSPNTDMETVASISTSIIAVVAVSVALILAAITVLLLHFRQSLHNCLKRWNSRKKRTPVNTKDILCYDEAPSPRYASPYSSLQPIPSNFTKMSQPSMYSPYPPTRLPFSDKSHYSTKQSPYPANRQLLGEKSDHSSMHSPHPASRLPYSDKTKSDQFPDSLMRHDQYFITLARQNHNSPLSQL